MKIQRISDGLPGPSSQGLSATSTLTRSRKRADLSLCGSGVPDPEIHIDGRRIGPGDPVYFIAEIGSNFDGDLSRAKALIHLAKEAGADAAKFQHYTADSLVSDLGFRQLGTPQSHQADWEKSIFETYRGASLDRTWTRALRETCAEAGITFMTSPYSVELVDYVDPFVPAYKIGSGDISWPDMIRHVALKGKPVLLGTGAATMEDVRRAADVILGVNPQLVLLQCNTNYTSATENYRHLQLKVLQGFERQYPGVILGLSDHMPGHTAVLGAVALGARVIEKHFTDSNERDGPDHSFAMTPPAWREMVERTRELEAALGNGEKTVEENELDTVIAQRRCVRVTRDVGEGEMLSLDDLTMLRPCPRGAIEPYDAFRVVGKRITRPLLAGEHLTHDELTQ
jgi:sialic acid synthase SpsE